MTSVKNVTFKETFYEQMRKVAEKEGRSLPNFISRLFIEKYGNKEASRK